MANNTVGIGFHVEEARGPMPPAQRVAQDFDVRLCALGQQPVRFAEALHEMRQIALAGLRI